MLLMLMHDIFITDWQHLTAISWLIVKEITQLQGSDCSFSRYLRNAAKWS